MTPLTHSHTYTHLGAISIMAITSPVPKELLIQPHLHLRYLIDNLCQMATIAINHHFVHLKGNYPSYTYQQNCDVTIPYSGLLYR